jgi:hypothetical protein
MSNITGWKHTIFRDCRLLMPDALANPLEYFECTSLKGGGQGSARSGGQFPASWARRHSPSVPFGKSPTYRSLEATVRLFRAKKRSREIRRLLLVSRTILALGALAGCSGATLTNAVSLSKTGQTAASAADQAAVASSSQYAAYQDTDAFLHGFAGSPTKDPALVALEDKNQAELTARGAMFISLAKAYASFGNLGAYNASGEFQTDVTDLFSSINTYQKAIGQPQLNSTLTSVAPPAIGLFVGWIQSEIVLAANDQLRTQVANIIKVMSDPLVHAQFVGPKKMIVGELARNANLLMQRGLLSPKPYFDTMGQPLGMSVSDNFSSALKSDRLAQQGIVALIAVKQKNQADLVDASYESSLSAVRDLLPLHDKLKAGQPLDLTQIDQAIQKLSAIAAAISPPTAKGTK